MTRSTTTAPTVLVRVLQGATGLTVLNVLLQFVTAGQLFPEGGPEELHAGGAIFLHVFSGIAAIAAIVLWRQKHTTATLPVLAVVVFLATILQAAIGGRDTLWMHIPGAMVLTAGVVWLLVLVFRPLTRA
jgi:hypothetical protein